MISSPQAPLRVEPLDGRTLRQVCGTFVTGVTVITTGVGAATTGATVNSFTSVSLDPPLVLFCLHRGSRLLSTLRHCGAFAVNVLAGHQEPVARAFASRSSASVDDLDHHRAARGMAVLSDALAFLVCDVSQELPGGDHVIVLGQVVELGTLQRPPPPLAFFRGALGALDAVGPAVPTMSRRSPSCP